MATTYTCAECGAKADVVEGEVVRTCEHVDAPVTADIQAVVYGEGGAQ